MGREEKRVQDYSSSHSSFLTHFWDQSRELGPRYGDSKSPFLSFLWESFINSLLLDGFFTSWLSPCDYSWSHCAHHCGYHKIPQTVTIPGGHTCRLRLCKCRMSIHGQRLIPALTSHRVLVQWNGSPILLTWKPPKLAGEQGWGYIFCVYGLVVFKTHITFT